jgi:hypothetical protein
MFTEPLSAQRTVPCERWTTMAYIVPLVTLIAGENVKSIHEEQQLSVPLNVGADPRDVAVGLEELVE